MTVTGQPQVTYAYFDDDLLKTITRGTNIVNLTYDVANRPATTTIPNGMVETWTYDQASRMTQIDYDKGATHYSTLDYAYDPAGRRTKVWAGFARVTLPAATTANATYDAANELNTWNGTALTYDQDGNLATNGAQTYTFDERNQLTATSGGTSTFKYDGLGRRYEKTVSGTTTRNLYDGPNVVQELNGSNAVTANSITGFGPDQVFWRNSGGVNKNVLTDGLGSTLATYNSNATPGLQNKFTYDPYGTPDSTAFPYLFTGANYDSATGLQYNRVRHYAPAFGRFIAEDPIGVAGGSANGYLYALDAPTRFTDPFGLNPGECIAHLEGGCITRNEGLTLYLDFLALLLSSAAFAAFIIDSPWAAPLFFWGGAVSFAGFLQSQIVDAETRSLSSTSFANGAGTNAAGTLLGRTSYVVGPFADFWQLFRDLTHAIEN